MRKSLVVLALVGAAGLAAQTSGTQSAPADPAAAARLAVGEKRKAVAADTANADLHVSLGMSFGDLGRVQAESGDFMGAMESMNGAFAAMEKACALAPGNFDAHFLYGVYAVNVPALFGRLDSGLKHLETAASLAARMPEPLPPPRAAAVYRYLGDGYRLANRVADARTAWTKALDLEPSGPTADAARRGLEETARPKATEPAPGPDPAALTARAREALAGGRPAEASALFKQVVDRDTANLEAWTLYARALEADAMAGYDGRVYENQDVRTNLAFEATRALGRIARLDPSNPGAKLAYAVMCVQMPFFVGRMDEGLSLLESLSKDEALPDSLRNEALYQLGYGLRKKGRGVWADFVKNRPEAPQTRAVYEEYGLRERGATAPAGARVEASFHLGFQDELEPQTAVWVTDAAGRFVKTLYVSGFAGFAKEKQVNLPEWGRSSGFETDGTTGASIDWGRHTAVWDLKDRSGRRAPDGDYTVHVEASWWPSMRYEAAEAAVRVGKKPAEAASARPPLIPRLEVRYRPGK